MDEANRCERQLVLRDSQLLADDHPAVLRDHVGLEYAPARAGR